MFMSTYTYVCSVQDTYVRMYVSVYVYSHTVCEILAIHALYVFMFLLGSIFSGCRSAEFYS